MNMLQIETTSAVVAMDTFNRVMQKEIENAVPSVALELAHIKYEVNKRFDERRRQSLA